MPSGEPNPDAPVTVWAGEYDAQAIADATGASWAAPIFALNQPRIVVLADLCAAPAPSAPVFTTTDLVQSMNPFADNTALRLKLQNYVDAGLWRVWCTPVDDPAPPPIPDNPRPPDVPEGPPPPPSSLNEQHEIWQWMKWMVKNFIPLVTIDGNEQVVSGSGSITWPREEGGEWPTYPYGVKIWVSAIPDYAGRTDSGEPVLHYELGWVGIGEDPHTEAPVRLARVHQVVRGSHSSSVFTYNLRPGVEIHVFPLYPGTAELEGG